MAGWFDPARIHTGLDFYRQIVESTHDCVKVLDLDGRLVYLTPKAQELLGICDLEGFLNRPTADQVSRMREPFYTTKPEGLGLGLAICREILRAHRSELQAERRRAGGLTFSFVLRTTTRANARKRSGLVAGRNIGTRGATPPERLFASEAKRTSGMTKEQR